MKTSAKILALVMAVMMVATLLVPSVLADETNTTGYTSVSTGFKGIPAEYAFSAQYVSAMTILSSDNTNGQPSAIDNKYKYAGPLYLGADEFRQEFFFGLGMHPKKGTDESWTNIDVSTANADRFYSVVGLTNEASKGVTFKVFGDYGDGTYKLLSESESITGRKTGEFDLDITGVKTLRLVVMSTTGDHSSSACAWGNAAVYSTAVKDTTPPETETPTTEATEETQAPTTEATEETQAPTTEATQKPSSNKPVLNDPNDKDNEGGISVGLIIGICAAVLVAACVTVFLIVKKKGSK